MTFTRTVGWPDRKLGQHGGRARRAQDLESQDHPLTPVRIRSCESQVLLAAGTRMAGREVRRSKVLSMWLHCQGFGARTAQ